MIINFCHFEGGTYPSPPAAGVAQDVPVVAFLVTLLFFPSFFARRFFV